jgi:hypothetical protein
VFDTVKILPVIWQVLTGGAVTLRDLTCT